MHGAATDTILDATIGAIAARAALYPAIVKQAQPRPIQRSRRGAPATADPAIRWLLLNAQQTNRCLMGTG